MAYFSSSIGYGPGCAEQKKESGIGKIKSKISSKLYSRKIAIESVGASYRPTYESHCSGHMTTPFWHSLPATTEQHQRTRQCSSIKISRRRKDLSKVVGAVLLLWSLATEPHRRLKTALCGGRGMWWHLPSYFRPLRHKSR